MTPGATVAYPMHVLIACEESQRVCAAFRAKGHEAYSCDILPTSGEHPEWHIKDKIEHFVWNDHFLTQDNLLMWNPKGWDLLIAFPPCTHLAVSGARWFKDKVDEQKHAVAFFMYLTKLGIPKIAIENPIGIMSTLYRKPDQIIQPWQFGHGETKATCLWLKNLPKLVPTNIVEGREARVHKMAPGSNRARDRARTYPGIAKAMAEQWGGVTA